MFTSVVLTLTVMTAMDAVRSDPTVRTCEPIRVEMCKNLGYNVTGMPNLARHNQQADADVTMQTFGPLIQYGCSSQLQVFLCSVYVPMCTDKVAVPIGPCRGLCESVYERCYPLLRGFGFPWPAELNCSRFPPENNHEHMCMEGPGEVDGSAGGVRTIAGTSKGSTCKQFARAGAFAAAGRDGRCAQYCEAEVLFSSSERRLAEVWLSTWAALSLACSLCALAAWAFGGGGAGAGGERALAALALCSCAAAAGWVVRAAAGRAAAGCAPHALHPHRLLLAHDGLANPNCAVVFLLLYYFGMAAAVWWVVLACSWRSSVLRRGSVVVAPVQGVSSVPRSRHSSLLRLAAWGAPAALAAVVLVTRDVDADELTGTCFVGNQSTKSLLGLVIIPHLICLLVGGGFLISGIRGLLKSPCVPQQPPSLLPLAPTVNLRKDPTEEQNLLRLGTFAALYTVPSIAIVASWIYEYIWRDEWLAAPNATLLPAQQPEPAFWVFMVRIFMSQILGVMTAVWVVTPKAKFLWRRVCGGLGPQTYKPTPVKCVPQQLAIHCYGPPPHASIHQKRSHTAHSMASHKYSTYSHGGSYRKPRSHHTHLSMSGGETIL